MNKASSTKSVTNISSNAPNKAINLTNIHQIIFDLDNNLSDSNVQKILNQAISYLNHNQNQQMIDELFFLLNSCFTKYPNQLQLFYTKILEILQANSNFLAVWISFYSEFQHNSNLTIINSSLIKNIYERVLYLLQNRHEKFTIFDQEIHDKYKENFIVNIILMNQVDANSTKIIYHYIMTNDGISKSNLNLLIKKIVDDGHLNSLPEKILTKKDAFDCFSFEDLAFIIPMTNKETFSTIIPNIENTFSDIDDLNANLAASILNKYIEYGFDMTSKLEHQLINSITYENLTPEILKYFVFNNILLPKKLADKIVELPNSIDALAIMPDLNKVPSHIIKDSLLEISDWKLYERIFTSLDNLEPFRDVFSQQQFWIHILYVVLCCTSCYSYELIEKFGQIFEKYVNKKDVYDVFYGMIFDHFPTSKEENKFMKKLLKHINEDYKKEFYQNSYCLITQINEMKAFPHPSFWKIFNLEPINYIFETEILDPIFLFAYEFAYNKESRPNIHSITINSFDENLITEFINKGDFDALMNYDDNSVSFILSAFIFASCKEKPEIHGLTNETLFPFLAIAFKHLNHPEGNLLINIENDDNNFLLTTFDFLSNNESPLIIASINAILNYSTWLFDPNIFPTRLAYQLLEIFIKLVKYNCYKANIFILVWAISQLSMMKNNKKKFFPTYKLFNEYGITIFQSIIQSLQMNSNFYDEIENSNFKLNLRYFKTDDFQKYITNILSNSSSLDSVSSIILFLEKYCIKVPKFEIENFQYLENILKDKLAKKNIKDFLVIDQFIINNNFKQKMRKISVPMNCTDQILLDLTKTNIYYELMNQFDILYKILMKDRSISIYYYTILLEKICNETQCLNPSVIINSYSKQFERNPTSFINALNNAFYYHQENNCFVRRTEYLNASTPLSKYGVSVIKKLFKLAKLKQDNYQPFVFLQNIAASFPFLLNEDINEVFEIILPSLNNFSLFFTIQKDSESKEIESKLKTCFSALSFLHSALHSVKIIDFFFPWFFDNIDNFTNAQILALSYVICSLINTNGIQVIVHSILLKYDFQKVFVSLLKKNFEKELIFYYKSNWLKILIQFFSIFEYLEKDKGNMIFNKGLQNEKNPFSIAFDNRSTIYPYNLAPLNIHRLNPRQEVEDSKYFFKKINETRDFWISYKPKDIQKEVKDDVVEKLISDFCKNFKNKQKSLDTNNLPSIPEYKNYKMMSFLHLQPRWIYNWIVKNEHFPIYPEHKKQLVETINKMIQITNKCQHIFDDDKYIDISSIKLDDFYTYLFSDKDLHVILLKNVISCDDSHFKLVCKLFKIILRNNITMTSVFNLLNNFLVSKKNNPYISKSVKRFVDLFAYSDICLSFPFRNSFIKICGKSFIDLVLIPEFRNDQTFLSKAIKLFISSYQKLPLETSHLIGFMFMTRNYDLMTLAFSLSEKIGEGNLNDIKKIIKKVFLEQINKTDLSYEIISHFIDVFPSLIKEDVPAIYIILEKLINDCQNDDFDDEYLIQLIYSLFNLVSPKKEEDQSDILNKENSLIKTTKEKSKDADAELILLPANDKIKSTDPIFWDFYEKERSKLAGLIECNKNVWINFKFLLDFPKLLNFKFRLNYFRSKAYELLSREELEINIDASKILFDSFEKLSNKTNKEWLRKFHINFDNQEGCDCGGLTKEFFSLISKELFKSDYALFVQKDNLSFHPNSLSSINEEHIDFFNFTGKLIARALIGGITINADLTKSFCRQILTGKVKFEDLKDFDHTIYDNFQVLLKEDADQLYLGFAYTYDEYGQVKTCLLKDKNNENEGEEQNNNDNDEEIPVNNENKVEYVRLYTDNILRKSVVDQMDAFREGFYSLMPSELIEMFSPSELNQLICGSSQIDVSDFKQNVEFRYPYSSSHEVIKMFFDVISEWSNEELSNLLMFITGSPKVPVNGFKNYYDRGCPIKIVKLNGSDSLCQAHTCFNQLDLPPYENKEKMNSKLKFAIENCTGYQNS
ncbi:hypothetical protein M9Y10_008736 [Tritrichomonas musculus]|uniref:HECT-type E3 ubiquitin transferase n=1 Tax=Tritrichomonas musculus TaxID=1915356 RepID=A0ABR2IYX1_9EUKA